MSKLMETINARNEACSWTETNTEQNCSLWDKLSYNNCVHFCLAVAAGNFY